MKYLKPHEYEHLAPESPGYARSNHESIYCSGSSLSLRVTRLPDGSIKAHCYRCGAWGKTGSPLGGYIKTAAAIAKHKRKTTKVKRVFLPSDGVQDLSKFPVSVSSKLYTYGITQADVETYGLTWSNSYQRLIYPIYKDRQLSAWQGRSWDKSEPKYITQYSDTTELFCYIPNKDGHTGRGCVIVEDMLSAIRCARHSNALAMMGSDVGDRAVAHLMDSDKKFLVFNDFDNRIIKMKALELQQRLTSVGKKVKVVIGEEKDPKELTEEELSLIISKLDSL